MGKDTGIAWCDHTFNPWWGCAKISPGCKHCYAATFDKRVGGDNWKVEGPRRFFGDKHWREPENWNRDAERARKRARVFCASMADVFEDRRDLDEHRARLWALIERTPWLDWLLLTKRPENLSRMLPWSPVVTNPASVAAYGAKPREVWGRPWPNVWLGTTTEDQEHADRRVPLLLAVPAVVRFLSVEPMIGPVDVHRWLPWVFRRGIHHNKNGTPFALPAEGGGRGIDWIIAGCESGHHARPAEVGWFRSLRDQCAAAEVPFLLKQAVAADLVTIGAGSFTKERGNLIELPYLDGTQHAAFPNPTTAAPAAETSEP